MRAAKYLIALTDVGLFIQCRLRECSKEREEDISKNKSNPESQGEGRKKEQAGTLLTTTVILQKDKDEMEDWCEAPGICRGREPLPGDPL